MEKEISRERGMSNRYWQREEPVKTEANRLQWRLYRIAGKLQINRYFGYDGRQIVALDKKAITPEMITILKEFINLCEEKETK